MAQLGIFGSLEGFPEGFSYEENILSLEEERTLVRAFAGLPLKAFEFQGFQGKRRVVSFGLHYDFNNRGLGSASKSITSRCTRFRFSRTACACLSSLIAEFENDIRRERQLDGIAKAKERGVRFGVQPKLTEKMVEEIRKLRRSETIPEIMRKTGLSKASVYRALSRCLI